MDTAPSASSRPPQGQTVLLDAPALAQLRAAYPDWDIYRDTDTGRIVARHRTEQPDERRERWVIKTRVETATPEEMHPKLALQQAVREAEVAR